MFSKIIDTNQNSPVYSIKSGDQNLFSIDKGNGVVSYSKLATPGLYEVVVSVEEPGATPIATSDFTLYFNILAKDKPIAFANNSSGQHKLISSRNAHEFKKDINQTLYIYPQDLI